MSETIQLITLADGDVTSIRAPRLGRYSIDVLPGAVVDANLDLGRVHIVERSFALRLPSSVTGRVVSVASRARRTHFDYGAELFVLAPLGAEAHGDRHAHGAADAHDGGLVFNAPMDGQFYRRPSPAEPPFVPDGTIVNPGDRIGLIEVMKFFYPIRWEGEAAVRLVRFAVGDSVAVTAGQTLAYFERV
jgi:acetyl-CoA carboxylase biotin carboxyl carrier protein